MTEVTDKLSCWRVRLSEFDFDVLLRGGLKYQAAEAVSRVRAGGSESKMVGDEIPVILIFRERQTIMEIQRTTPKKKSTTGNGKL